MTYGYQHNAESVTSSTTLKTGHSKLIACYCTKSSAGSKLDLRNGTQDTDPILLTVEGENVQSLHTINKVFSNGLRATITGTASYLVVFE